MPDRGFRSGHHGIAGGHLFQISGDEHSPSLAPVKQRLRTGEIRCGIGPATSTSTPLTRSQCRFTAQIASEAPRRNRSDPTPVAVRSHRGMSPPLPSVGRIFRVDSTRQSMLVPPEILFDWLRRRVLLRVHRNWGRSFVPVVLRELSKIATNGKGSWQRKARFGDTGTEFSMVKHELKFQRCLERKSWEEQAARPRTESNLGKNKSRGFGTGGRDGHH